MAEGLRVDGPIWGTKSRSSQATGGLQGQQDLRWGPKEHGGNVRAPDKHCLCGQSE